MECQVCKKVLRKDNNIGVCRKHRGLSFSRRAYEQNWQKANKERYEERKKAWSKRNPEYFSERLKKDPQAKLAHTIRTRINRIIKQKPASAVKSVGCSVEELKKYLESKFAPGMTWENHGEWHVDHIKPLSKFDLSNLEEYTKACHYSNLQPLWASDNIRKGNKIQSSQECPTSQVDDDVR